MQNMISCQIDVYLAGKKQKIYEDKGVSYVATDIGQHNTARTESINGKETTVMPYELRISHNHSNVLWAYLYIDGHQIGRRPIEFNQSWYVNGKRTGCGIQELVFAFPIEDDNSYSTPALKAQSRTGQVGVITVELYEAIYTGYQEFPIYQRMNSHHKEPGKAILPAFTKSQAFQITKGAYSLLSSNTGNVIRPCGRKIGTVTRPAFRPGSLVWCSELMYMPSYSLQILGILPRTTQPPGLTALNSPSRLLRASNPGTPKTTKTTKPKTKKKKKKKTGDASEAAEKAASLPTAASIAAEASQAETSSAAKTSELPADVARTSEPMTEEVQTPQVPANVTQTATPTANVTQTAKPTANVTQTAKPTANVTQTAKSTANATQTSKPTAKATQTAKPTAKATEPSQTPADVDQKAVPTRSGMSKVPVYPKHSKLKKQKRNKKTNLISVPIIDLMSDSDGEAQTLIKKKEKTATHTSIKKKENMTSSSWETDESPAKIEKVEKKKKIPQEADTVKEEKATPLRSMSVNSPRITRSRRTRIREGHTIKNELLGKSPKKELIIPKRRKSSFFKAVENLKKERRKSIKIKSEKQANVKVKGEQSKVISVSSESEIVISSSDVMSDLFSSSDDNAKKSNNTPIAQRVKRNRRSTMRKSSISTKPPRASMAGRKRKAASSVSDQEASPVKIKPSGADDDVESRKIEPATPTNAPIIKKEMFTPSSVACKVEPLTPSMVKAMDKNREIYSQVLSSFMQKRIKQEPGEDSNIDAGNLDVCYPVDEEADLFFVFPHQQLAESLNESDVVYMGDEECLVYEPPPVEIPVVELD